jgi:hypothetical protein
LSVTSLEKNPIAQNKEENALAFFKHFVLFKVECLNNYPYPARPFQEVKVRRNFLFCFCPTLIAKKQRKKVSAGY